MRGDGRTVLQRLTGGDLLRPRALRADGPVARVALVQSAASLLAGDRLEIEVVVGPGARLELVEVGATVVHAGREATLDVRVHADGDARLLWDARPLILAEGSGLRRTIAIALSERAQALVRDTVVLGRAGEPGGALRSRTDVRHHGRPLHVEALATADRVLLRSPAVLGGARVLDVVACYGARGAGDGVLQLAGPGTLLVQVAEQTAATEPAARHAFVRWRDAVLSDPDGAPRGVGHDPFVNLPT